MAQGDNLIVGFGEGGLRSNLARFIVIQWRVRGRPRLAQRVVALFNDSDRPKSASKLEGDIHDSLILSFPCPKLNLKIYIK